MANNHEGAGSGSFGPFLLSGVIKVYNILLVLRGVHIPKVFQCKKCFKSTRCTQVCQKTDSK